MHSSQFELELQEEVKFRAGTISRENFVFQEGFLIANLRVSAVQ